MKKIRIYELAKELNMDSKDLIDKVKDLDLKITSHMSSISIEDAELIKELLDSGDSENKAKDDKNTIQIDDTIIVKDLAEKIGVSPSELITKLIALGIMANQNQEIDFDTASIVADEFDLVVERAKEDVESKKEQMAQFELDYEDDEKDLEPRPPVVTVMGHVDHGKTSLLDAIRKTQVTKREAGGITQHIGASIVSVEDEQIVFLDTPGHEAFTAMRARGTRVTDIAVLVVAADDGVMPQTVEAINHAKAADVPIVVAINKMDRPNANPDKIKQELVEYNLVSEDWGGDTICVPVSALRNEGIDELLEMILLVAEMEELKANPDRKAVGTIIDAQLDKGKGPVATVLVQKGTLNVGDMVVSGSAYGRVRAMFDDNGKNVKSAAPSIPVMILGLSEVPNAGESLYATEDEKTARDYAEKRKELIREEKLSASQNVSLDELFDKIKEGEVKQLNVIIKADVRGSIEAIKQTLSKLETDEVEINAIHGGVGGISESDIMLAAASNAIVIGFNVRPSLTAMDLAERENVDVRTYRVIYDAVEDIEAAIAGLHEPKLVEKVIGRAEIRATFKVPQIGTVAGIYVQQGKVTRNSKVRLLRDDIVIHEGDVSSLKRFKNDVREVATGYEGGLGIENFNDIKEGDIIEAYILEEVKR